MADRIAAFGGALVTRRFLPDRLVWSVAALTVLIMWNLPMDMLPAYTGDIELFSLSGIFMVGSGIILLMMHSDLVIRFFERIGELAKGSVAVTRTALSYSLDSKFRTGMTIAMFALIIFTITTMMMLVSIIGGNLEEEVEEKSGGFDIIVRSYGDTPITDFESRYAATNASGDIDRYYAFPTVDRPLLGKSSAYAPDMMNLSYPVVGVPYRFMNETPYEFTQALEPYHRSEPEAIWEALRTNSSLAVADAGTVFNPFGAPPYLQLDLGEVVTVMLGENRTVNLTIIAHMETGAMSGFGASTALTGVFVFEPIVVSVFNASGVGSVLVDVKDDADVTEVAHDLERNFLPFGAQAVDIKAVIAEGLQQQNQIFDLFNVYLSIGLVVGISGLGIITIRSVHERRRHIGMMRAIGFTRSQVVNSFLVEGMFVSLLGILMGMALGLLLGWGMWRDGFKDAGYDLVVPWAKILTLTVVSLVSTLLCIIPPSRMAAKVAPAEALRYD